MIITVEYIYNNHPKMDEINNIIQKTRLEHIFKGGIKWPSQVRIIFNVQFFGKTNNKIKNITTKKIKKINYGIKK